MRDSGIDPIILDAGDLFFTTPKLSDKNRESEFYRAGVILDGYEKIGCDAINVGHYELAAGLAFLKKMDNECNIPFISANLRDATTGKLLFDPYVIIERLDLKIGIVGVTDMKPDTMEAVSVDDYITAGNKVVDKIKNEVDLIAVLVNIERGAQQTLPNTFTDADFIYTSGGTHLTRPTNPQKDGGPYLYSFGKQGKYMSIITALIQNAEKEIVDVSGYENKIKSVNRRLQRLQKKDPDKSLEEIYAKQANVLKLIEQCREDLTKSEQAIASAVNTLKFEMLPLDRKIKDDDEMLAFVDKSLATCNSLNKEQPKSKGKPHKHKSRHRHGKK